MIKRQSRLISVLLTLGVVAFCLPLVCVFARTITNTASVNYTSTSDQAFPSQSDTATINVESGPPGATIIRPEPGDKVSGDGVLIKAMSEDTDIADINFQYRLSNLGVWTDITSSADTGSIYSAAWDTIGLPNGSYDLRPVASGKAGTDPDPPIITITVDHLNPDYSEYALRKGEDNVIENGDGIGIKIPAGALNCNYDCIIKISRPAQIPPPGENPANIYIEIEIENCQPQLNEPAIISVPYPDADNNDIVDGTNILEENLKVNVYNGSNWEVLSTTIDPMNNIATGTTTHFSIFGLFGGPDSIYGQVTDTEGTGLKDVKIEVLKAGAIEKFTLTDSNGSYSISGLTGTYSLRASKKEWVTQTKDNINPGNEVNFTLIPSKFKTYVYPNPFRMNEKDCCIIKFHLPEASPVTIRIYNIAGELVRELVDEDYPAGTYRIEWNGKNDDGDKVASGIYLYITKTEEKIDVKKIAVIK